MTASSKCTDLDLRLQQFLFSYRNTVRRSTGRTPSMLMFGRPLRSVLDQLKPDVVRNIDTEKLKQKIIYDTSSVEKCFNERDQVWVKSPLSKKSEKGQIVKINGSYSYLVKINGTIHRKHADQLRYRYSQILDIKNDTLPEQNYHYKLRNRTDLGMLPRKYEIIL